MKVCTHCKQEKPFEAFYTSSTHKSGYASWCKQCEAERSKAKYENRKPAQLIKAKEWRETNKEAYNASIKAWRIRNPGRHEQIIKEWSKRNPDKVNARWMKYDASKKHRTPAWLSEDELWMIEQAYDIAQKRTVAFGFSWHVDHIVPLQGKTVSGLHVPWNLQVLTSKDNQIKSNKFSAEFDAYKATHP